MQGTFSQTSLTAELVEQVRSKKITPGDLEMAALFTLDAIANVIAGQNSAPGQILQKWWDTGAHSNMPADPGRHAFLMGALCHILETDDLHRASVVHPGCVVVPASWALAEKEGIGGKDFLISVLHGFEVATRVGMAVGPAHYRIWHNTATCGPFGAAMAAASLLGLNNTQTMHALGNAGSQSSGLWQFLETGAMTKHLHAGRAAESGIRAAELAALGFTGPPQILEGEKGFFRATCTDADPQAVIRDAEAPWQLVQTSIKPWPSCRHTHPVIDAGEELKANLQSAGYNPENIKRIEIETYRAALDVCDRPVVASDYEAKFSLQHTIAAALLIEHVDFAAFGDEARKLCAPLASRVEIAATDPWVSAYPRNWGACVRIHLEDGSTFEATRTDAKGDPEAPLSHDDMVAKAAMLLTHGGHASPSTFIDNVLAMAEDGPLPSFRLA